MKVSELLEYLKALPPDTTVWFEDDDAYAEVGAAVYIPALRSVSIIPEDIQANFDFTHEKGSQILGDPTCVLWCDLVEEEQTAENVNSSAEEGAWIPGGTILGDEDDDEAEDGFGTC